MADPFISSADAERLQDALKALQGEPWLDLMKRRARGGKLRDDGSVTGGGGDAGGSFANRQKSQQRVRNAIRAPQAVVKIVRSGGAGSARDLVSQLTYLSREGELTLDEYQPDGTNFDLVGKSEIDDLSRSWAQRWDEADDLDGRAARARTKTYHMIVSFPEGTDEERAHESANTFADKFLTSGEFGDRWSHIRAWHTDRAHPHMHIVIDRRGESGVMMQINPSRDISPARLRGLQVDAAAEHGLLLNDTPRVSRGLSRHGPSTAEWRAGRREPQIDRRTTERRPADLALEATALRDLARNLELGRLLAPDTDPSQQQQRFITALDEAAMTLEQGKDLDLMEPQTPNEDRITLEALGAMSVDDLAETMRTAVREAEEIAPQLMDETQRTKLEIETGRIRELYAPYVPEFAAAVQEKEPYDGLGRVIDSRLGADEERERAFYEPDHDGYDNDLDPEPTRTAPSKTLSDADTRIIEAYAARGMNGERALSRIKGGMEATQETRSFWHEQEIKERMRAGDLSWSQAESQVADLHDYAVGTYRATTRAIARGVSLEATEIYAPQDQFAARKRGLDIETDLERSDQGPQRDAVVERDRDDPLVIIEEDTAAETDRPRTPADGKSLSDTVQEVSSEPALDKAPNIDPSAKPSHEEFMRRIEEEERALLKQDADGRRERGMDRDQDIDDGFGF